MLNYNYEYIRLCRLFLSKVIRKNSKSTCAINVYIQSILKCTTHHILRHLAIVSKTVSHLYDVYESAEWNVLNAKTQKRFVNRSVSRNTHTHNKKCCLDSQNYWNKTGTELRESESHFVCTVSEVISLYVNLYKLFHSRSLPLSLGLCVWWWNFEWKKNKKFK